MGIQEKIQRLEENHAIIKKRYFQIIALFICFLIAAGIEIAAIAGWIKPIWLDP